MLHFNTTTDAEMTDASIVEASIPIIQLLRKSAIIVDRANNVIMMVPLKLK